MTAAVARADWVDESGRLTDRERRLKLFFMVQVLTCVFLQKVGLPVGGIPISLPLPMFFVGLAVLAWYEGIAFEPVRLVLFAVMTGTMVLAQLLLGTTFSFTSLLLLLVIYVSFLFRYTVRRQVYLDCLRFFLNIMAIACLLMIAQQVTQVVLSAAYWPNFERVIPASMTVPAYNYLQPVVYGSRFFKPNAVFFVEVSMLSQYIVLALVIELVWFQRLWRLVFYGACLLIALAGTGIMILAMALPVLAVRLPRRMLVAGVVVAVVVLGGAVLTGLYDQLALRAAEFTTGGTSGYYRYTLPLQMLGEMARDPDFLFHGHGAGSTVSGGALLLLSSVKVVYEYGFVAVIAYLAFFIHATFAGAPSKRVAFVFLLFINVGGGSLTVPLVVILIAVVCTFFRIAPDDSPAASELTEAVSWR